MCAVGEGRQLTCERVKAKHGGAQKAGGLHANWDELSGWSGWCKHARRNPGNRVAEVKSTQGLRLDLPTCGTVGVHAVGVDGTLEARSSIKLHANTSDQFLWGDS